jgi:uridine kinase
VHYGNGEIVAPTYLIGITGPSGAGKTYLASHLAETLKAPVLHLDAYYRDLAHLPMEERAMQNFDDPKAIDHELLVEQARKISKGELVEIPIYDFATHTRRPGNRTFHAADVVIIEGLFALYWPALRRLLRTKVYVDMSENVCLERRIFRDMHERGRTRDSVQEQFCTTVAPGAELHVSPTRAHADVVLWGDTAIEIEVALVVQHMQQTLAEVGSG